LLAAVVVWLILVLRGSRSEWRRLTEELGMRLPVFSAETTRGREAEFIRDRLPRRTPRTAVVALAALLVAGVALWWWLR
jgi:hypothetical protein